MTTEPTEPAATFFQPGYTYRMGEAPYTAPEALILFRVEHVTRHPTRGHLRAIGWVQTQARGDVWRGWFQDEGEFGGWTELPAEPTPVPGLRVPAVGDRYVSTDPGKPGRTVTVTRVWTDGDGHTAVAYEWRDDKPGTAGSACPLGVFLGTYQPEAAEATPDSVTVTAAHVEAALRGWLAMFEYDLHKGLECGEEDGADHYPEEAADLFDRLRSAAAGER